MKYVGICTINGKRDAHIAFSEDDTHPVTYDAHGNKMKGIYIACEISSTNPSNAAKRKEDSAMTDEQKRIISDIDQEMCADCPFHGEPYGCNREDRECTAWNIAHEAADEIKRLANEVERLKRPFPDENGGYTARQLGVLLHYAKQMNEQLEREKDAAVSDMVKVAQGGVLCDVCATMEICRIKGIKRKCQTGGECEFQWRGPCAENGGYV